MNWRSIPWGTVGKYAFDLLMLGAPILVRWARGGKQPSKRELRKWSVQAVKLVLDDMPIATRYAKALARFEQTVELLAQASGAVFGERERAIVESFFDELWTELKESEKKESSERMSIDELKELLKYEEAAENLIELPKSLRR